MESQASRRRQQALEMGVSSLRSRVCEACKYKYQNGLGDEQHNCLRKRHRRKGLLPHDVQCHAGVKRCGGAFAYFKERSASARALCVNNFDKEVNRLFNLRKKKEAHSQSTEATSTKRRTKSHQKTPPHKTILTVQHKHAMEQTRKEGTSFGNNFHFSLEKYKYTPNSVGNRHRVTMHCGIRDMYKSMYLDQFNNCY
eukprot:m.95263 g.95263  ORF g.95263 m.95263 type:complete len:197 (+) comp12432_c0_seq2:50-640(+)